MAEKMLKGGMFMATRVGRIDGTGRSTVRGRAPRDKHASHKRKRTAGGPSLLVARVSYGSGDGSGDGSGPSHGTWLSTKLPRNPSGTVAVAPVTSQPSLRSSSSRLY